jgi:hypothetical protein
MHICPGLIYVSDGIIALTGENASVDKDIK